MKYKLKPHWLSVAILFSLLDAGKLAYSVEFNTDVLDAEDKNNIDFSRFSSSNYILPGRYPLTLRLNDRDLSDFTVPFYPREEKKNSSEACLLPELMKQLGLTPTAEKKIRYWHHHDCADLSALQGTEVRGDLASASLQVSIPQAWLEYTDPNWVTPAQWDNGIPGLMLDYSLNSTVSRLQRNDHMHNASVSGTAGANLGAWRMRTDYQGSYVKCTASSRHNLGWNRFYAYRALPQMGATVMLGEIFLASNLFDSWRYTGISLNSDERMLPPSLRGYAAEVSGIARTNAKVTVSQLGKVVYQTTVASGPFRIQSLNSAVNGQLDVKVEEQDGSVQTFQVDNASVPYLTRPGQLRYATALGRPSCYDHHIEGPMFSNGVFSWGVANSWSLYGGTIMAEPYKALAIGIGRNLYRFGAISADVTQSWARLPNAANREGKSWHLSYAKRFDDFNSEVTFAGYRFSEREYMSMGHYLDTRYGGGNSGQDKALYTLTANKGFEDAKISAYLSYSHQTYWDQSDNHRYSLSLSRYFDISRFKNASLSLSATRSEYYGHNDDTLFMSLSVPLSNAMVSYNGQLNDSRYSQTVGFYSQLDNYDSYRLTGGLSEGTHGQLSGYYIHRGDKVDMSVNAAYVQNSYTSAGLSLQGGATVTANGAALHPGGGNGSTRLMVDSDGVAGVPIEGGRIHTNAIGIGVLADMSSYYRTSTRIDVNQLDDDVEASKPVVESSLTEGAIGYRKFGLLKGVKLLVILAMADGTHPPFGASVINRKGHELAVVSDGGLAYLSGVALGETLDVAWDSAKQCFAEVPKTLPPTTQWVLPCKSIH